MILALLAMAALFAGGCGAAFWYGAPELALPLGSIAVGLLILAYMLATDKWTHGGGS